MNKPLLTCFIFSDGFPKVIKLNEKTNLVYSFNNITSCFLFAVVNHWLNHIIVHTCDLVQDMIDSPTCTESAFFFYIFTFLRGNLTVVPPVLGPNLKH